MEPVTVTRSIRLDADARRVWDALADDDGLSGWLADRVELDVQPGAAGRLLDDDGAARRVVVTEVAEGTRLGFAWWSDDAPDAASSVVITIAGEGDATTVTVTETLDPTLLATVGRAGGSGAHLTEAAVVDLIGLGDAWAERFGRLAGALRPAHVLAGA